MLVKLSLLMAAEDIDLLAMSALVETDMALAAAVLKAVNSSLYGLRGKVQTVHQALTYLGMREVSGITFEMGLRAAFPPAAELDPGLAPCLRARRDDGPLGPDAGCRSLGRAFGWFV